MKALRLLAVALIVLPGPLWAQDLNEGLEQKDLLSVEKDIEQNIPDEIVVPESNFKKPLPKANYPKVSEETAQDLAVIQRNYMPKTERWQASLMGTLVPSDVLYKTYGLTARLGYHFTEKWGFELNESYFTSSKSEDLQNLESKQRVSATNQTSIRNLLTGQIYFNQIYGKMAFLDKQIVPFELYNILGYGIATDQNGDTSNALTVGIGDLVSLSRSSAVRIELSLSIFQSKTVAGDKSTTNFIFLNIGYSRFFPEPDYR